MSVENKAPYQRTLVCDQCGWFDNNSCQYWGYRFWENLEPAQDCADRKSHSQVELIRKEQADKKPIKKTKK